MPKLRESLFTYHFIIKYTVINTANKGQGNGQIIDIDVLIQMQGPKKSNYLQTVVYTFEP